MTEKQITSVKNPLVTLVLYAFNEETFIHEAVDSVLGQDYSPLEIVLSDDGSSDRTFEIMQEMASAYSGPHKIYLNQNETNIGICSQINAAVQKTQGELILLANGDDVCLPYRVSRTVKAWESQKRDASVIVSPLQVIDESGEIVAGEIIPNNKVYSSLVEGLESRFGGVGSAASVALRRDVFTLFQPLNPALILEDNPLMMRAFILGKVMYMDEPTVLYRVHSENISQAYMEKSYNKWRLDFFARCLWQRKEGVKAYTQELIDLQSPFINQNPPNQIELARFIAMSKIVENELFRQFYDTSSTLTAAQRFKIVGRLLLIFIKNTLKDTIPYFKERNVRQQYESQFGKGRF